jgi:hypothetical protein
MEQINIATLLLLIPFGWAMCVSGRQINRWICPKLSGADIAPMERSAFGLASGAILASQGILVIGLTGHLDQKPVEALFVILALIGILEFGPQIQDIAGSLVSLSKVGWKRILWLASFCAIAFGALSGALLPPISTEWDSLSYHLADPKIYVAAHRIMYIPWESHSNFAFNMEMLYSVGLLFGSVALAKLFAFKIGAIGVCGVYYLGQRVLRKPGSGLFGALIFATLPLVFWESGTAYVDLVATSFAAMALLALVLMIRFNEPRFAWLAGVMLGGMLGIKATALVTIGLYAIGIIAHARLNSPGTKRAVKSAAVMVAIALVVGCSWYVKAFVNTGNPVYPFASSIFAGRNWDPNQSAAYAADQHVFGMGHQPSDLLLAPWNLTMFLVPGHIVPDGFPKPFNDYQAEIASLSPLFLIALMAGLLTRQGPPRRIKLLCEYCILALVVWFAMTQQVRYFVPVLPALCVVTESILLSLYARSKPGKLAAVIALVGGIGFNLYVDGMLSARNWMVVAGGPATMTYYLQSGVAPYTACEFINSQTPVTDGVVTYGEPRTFYLDRQHMWGETGHSTVIPYGSFSSPQDLRRWLIKHGMRTILLNTQGAPIATDQPGWAGMVASLTIDSGNQPLFEQGSVYVYGI